MYKNFNYKIILPKFYPIEDYVFSIKAKIIRGKKDI